MARQIDRAVMAGRPFVFVDIGANVGLFSLCRFTRRRWFGGQARILAIELCSAKTCRRLRFNLDADPGLPVRAPAARARRQRRKRWLVEANRDDARRHAHSAA